MDIVLIGIIAILVSFSCSIIGLHLVLRQKSMLIDSITHTVLLGIVLGFLIIPDINSPFLILSAALMGIITVFLTETLNNTGLVKKDAAIGLIFPLLFSIAIIIMTKYLKNAHVDVHSVLLGKIEFSIFDKFYIGDYDLGPKALWIMGIIFIINALFVMIFYKELKITSFDTDFSKIVGFNPIWLNYALMALVSVTTVGAFQSVGSILVISFMVGPIVIAYFLAEDLKTLIFYSFLAGIVNSVIGIIIANRFDLSISGSIASVMGFSFILLFIFHKKNGLIGKLYHRNQKKREFFKINIMFHIAYHHKMGDMAEECNIKTIDRHFNKDKKIMDKYIESLIKDNEIENIDGILHITEKGMSKIEEYKYLME